MFKKLLKFTQQVHNVLVIAVSIVGTLLKAITEIKAGLEERTTAAPATA